MPATFPRIGVTHLARIQLLLGALLFSTGGVAIKLSTLSGWQVAGLRAAVGALVMLLFLPAARRGWSLRTCLVAIPYAATFILYTLANKETTAANAIFLQDTAPLYLLLLSPLLLRESIERWDVVLLCALAGGAWLLFVSTPEPLATAPRPGLGNVLALAAGVTWALSLLGLRWIAVRNKTSGEEPLAVILAGCVLAFAAAAIAVFPALLYPVAEWQTPNWVIILYLGTFQIGLAYVFVTRAMRRVSALEASLLVLTEPVFVPLWAWL
ncbi:MAG TPA: EamA family transporter, partial [Gammaproteobacteria bacterium]|nr:EamA family transporter [Gammaproteobacteria bacterium]